MSSSTDGPETSAAGVNSPDVALKGRAATHTAPAPAVDPLAVFVDPHDDSLYLSPDAEQRRIVWWDEKRAQWSWACQDTRCWGLPLLAYSDGSFGLGDPLWYGDHADFDEAVAAAKKHAEACHGASHNRPNIPSETGSR